MRPILWTAGLASAVILLLSSDQVQGQLEAIFVPYESVRESDNRKAAEQTRRDDISSERKLSQQRLYWINGTWIRDGKLMEPARNEGELIDSDGDGWDDYTEFVYQTNMNDPTSTPAAYFVKKGKNKVTFFSTNKAAHTK